MTNAELAVLSLISEKPRHGYDIEAQIEERGMREWTEIGFSSIYAVLKKLLKKGWVEAETIRSVGQGAPRKAYRISPAGRAAQRSAVVDALAKPGGSHSSLLLGLANLPILSKEKALDGLVQYCSALEARLEHLQTRAEEQQPLPDFVEAMFNYSETMIRAELSWLNTFIEKSETGHG